MIDRFAPRTTRVSRPAAQAATSSRARTGEIRINSNENPLGPGQRVLDAMAGKLSEAGRYPFNSTPDERALVSTLAAKFKIKAENIVVGAGSQEILKNGVRVFAAPARGLVAGFPTFENCAATARRLGYPVAEIKVDAAFRLDLDAMANAAKGTGLVYINNPNNPTGTVHGSSAIADFIDRIRRTSPDTAILIDEAYHDYVTDASYRSAVPLALRTPNVFVTRTLSKAYGMAGMRVGYAVGHAKTMARLAQLQMPLNVSVPGLAAAIAALGDERHIEMERARNTRVRAFTLAALDRLGCHSADSQGNFVFANVGRPAKVFRDACASHGVAIGRDFPPFEKTHVRISIGTLDEMEQATGVFKRVLEGTPAGDVSKEVS